MTRRGNGSMVAPLLVSAAAQLVPSVLALQSVRDPVELSMAPGLCGTGRLDHIALTFDDGPDPKSTPYVLDLLAAFGLRATFFVLGERAERHPELVRRAVAEGHEIAVHGWTHRCQLLQSPVRTSADIARAAECVADLAGTPPQFFRPPHGIPSGAGLVAARRAGMRTVLWTATGHDWGNTSARAITTRLRSGVRGGDTVLLHDASSNSDRPPTRKTTIPALVAMIPAWRARGLELGPLSEHELAAERHMRRAS